MSDSTYQEWSENFEIDLSQDFKKEKQIKLFD